MRKILKKLKSRRSSETIDEEQSDFDKFLEELEDSTVNESQNEPSITEEERAVEYITNYMGRITEFITGKIGDEKYTVFIDGIKAQAERLRLNCIDSIEKKKKTKVVKCVPVTAVEYELNS
jgi:hypothetical protein